LRPRRVVTSDMNRKFVGFVSVLLSLSTLFSIPVATGQTTGPPVAEKVSAMNAPAVVLFYAEMQATFSYPFATYEINNQGVFPFVPHPEKQTFSENVRQRWVGSGMIITPDGYILTNSHVATTKSIKQQYLIDLASKDLQRNLAAGAFSSSLAMNYLVGRYSFYEAHGKWGAEVLAVVVFLGVVNFVEGLVAKGIPTDVRIAGDPVNIGTQKDVAVVKINTNFQLPTVSLGDSDKVSVGHSVYVIGYPAMGQVGPGSVFEPTITAGIASSIKTMSDAVSGLSAGWNAIQTDAKIHGGNSGGPAFDSEGKVIGLATFGMSNSRGENVANFLVPVNIAKQFIGEIAVQPRRGRLDELWENALTLYWNRHYSAALEEFRKVTDIYPGHPYAERYSKQARTAIDEGKDVPLRPQVLGLDVTWVAAGVGIAAISIIIIVVALKRKARRAVVFAPTRAPPPTPTPPSSAAEMKYCISCGAPIPAVAKHCSKCGSAQG